MQYCGDETAALVGDLGSRSFKFGFAGEDAPKGWLPSCVGRGVGAAGSKAGKRVRVGDGALGASSEDTEVVWARREGRVADWDAVEALWSHALGTVLSSDPREHPVLACTATYESAADRAKLAELLAESLQVPAFFLARNAMLSAFSLGRASALVLDVGAARSVCAPVQDGFVLARGVRSSGVAGDLVDDHLVRLLETQLLPQQRKAAPGQRVPIRVPALMSKRPAPEAALEPQPAAWVVEDKAPERAARVAASYVDLQRRAVVQDLRANVCRVWTELGYEDSRAAVYAKERYELPDGTQVFLGPERFRSGELLVRPEFDRAFVAEQLQDKELPLSLPLLVKEALQGVHVDLRRELVQQIILVGGGSLMPGTVERLTKELALVLPSALKPRFLTPGKLERSFSTFTGGSILATLGSFQQLWISKKEYDEHGVNLVEARCVH